MPGNASAPSPPPHPGHDRGAAASRPSSGRLDKAKDALGAHGEELAVRHLAEAGFQVLDRNWRCAEGELDIVARDGSVLVVCEVKTRSGYGFGSPAQSVTPGKARRLRRLASRWLSQSHSRFRDVRFDVVGVVWPPGAYPQVQHLRGVC